MYSPADTDDFARALNPSEDTVAAMASGVVKVVMDRR